MELQEKLKDSFISGLILLTPLILTVVIIKFFLNWTAGITDIVVHLFGIGQYVGNDMLAGQIIVLTASAIFIVLAGIVARSYRGRKVLGGFGRLVNLVPMYRTLYFSLKHFANALVENKSHYENAVIVEYPERGIYRVGFTTSKTQKEIQEVDDRLLMNVFMPNSPNPTGGQMAILPEDRIQNIDLSVKEAFKLVMTTGISNEKVDNVLPEQN
jgi:uncharacterized membrane protein